MTDTPTPPRTAARFYVNAFGELERRVKGQPTTIIALPEDARLLRHLAVEGAISLSIRGLSAADIAEGINYPDRTPPAEKIAATSKREPTHLQKAIAAVRAADTLKTARAAGEKPTKDAIAAMHDRAMEWVKTLDKEALKTASKLVPVAVELARLKGKSGSLDDLLLVDPAPSEPAPDGLDQAAD